VSTIVLLNEAKADPDRGGIRFAAMVDNERISCFVFQEALFDHFGGHRTDTEGLVELLHAKQGRIHSTVRGKIADGAREPDGSILLRSADFWI